MNDINKDLSHATDGAETPTGGAEGLAGVNAPEDKKNATAGKKNGNSGVYAHKFKKPYEYEGTKYTTLNFYFENLTGRDMITIENEMQANNEFALDPLLSKNFQSKLAARAGNVASDVLETMPLPEFSKIVNAVRNFLIDSGY